MLFFEKYIYENLGMPQKSSTFAFQYSILFVMKVLQLGKFYPIEGGVEKTMFDLLTGLASKGVQCDMLCANAEKGRKETKLSENSRLICTQTLIKRYATMISPEMISVLRKIAPSYDIIHVHHPDPMAALALRLSGYKGKVVLHWHSDIVKQKKLLNLYLPLQQWLVNRADLVVGTSPVYIKSSPYLKGVQQKCTYQPSCVDPVKADIESAARIKDFYGGKKIVFSLGRLVHYKGYRYLIEAAKYLDDSYVVLIGGTGALKDKLQEQIEKDGLQDRVKLLGYIESSDLPSYFGACDLYCLSSIMKTEAFALVQIEAMSCGKPVVSCNIEGSGVPWVNANGVSGMVVPVEDSKALADAIRRIMEDEELYKQLSEGARQRFFSMFTKEQMIDNVLKIYSRVLDGA